MTKDDFKETGNDLYQEGQQARIHDVQLDRAKPRPWLLGWQDADRMLADLANAMADPEPMRQEERAALERLIQTAKRGTGQSVRVANFLLSWWNAEECGGFDFTDLWNVDQAIAADILSVIGLISRQTHYPDTLGYKADFEQIIRVWRPTLGVAPGQKIN